MTFLAILGLVILLGALGVVFFTGLSDGENDRPVEYPVEIPVKELPAVIVIEEPPIREDLERIEEGRRLIDIRIPDESLAKIPVEKFVRAKVATAVKRKRAKTR